MVASRRATLSGVGERARFRDGRRGFVDEDTVRRHIATVALRELDIWNNRGRPFVETDPAGTARITVYTLAHPTLSAIKLPTPRGEGNPWSAVFVSFCVITAAQELGLVTSPLDPHIWHTEYASATYAHTNILIGRYWAYPPDQHPLALGDIVIKNRDASQLGFGSLAAPGLQVATHGDIVVEVSNRRATIVGGNLGGRNVPGRDRVLATQYVLTADGRVDTNLRGKKHNEADRVFAVLSLVAGTSRVEDQALALAPRSANQRSTSG